jgi:hypothetical protein
MAVRANKPAFNIREKLKELTHSIGLKGSELMKSETSQEARNLISAGRKNMIINGDMRISQRATSVSASNNTYNTLDRWNTWINYNSGAVTMSQASAAPPGFYKSLQFYNNGNATTPQYHFVEQKIEAQNIPQLKMGTNDAEYMTLSFWVRSSVTGTFNVEISDDDGSHHVIKRYTINNAATWEYKTITIPPATNTGVPTYDNTMGLTVHWWISGGSSYNGTSADGKWQTYSTTRRNDGGNTTFADPDYWNITGVQLEVGKNATDFEHRSYGEELLLCQRYYQNSYNQALGQYPGDTSLDNGIIQTCWSDGNSPFGMFPTPMRAAPSVTLRERGTNNTGKVENSGAQKTASAQQVSNQGVGYIAVSNGVAGGWCAFTYELIAEL